MPPGNASSPFRSPLARGRTGLSRRLTRRRIGELGSFPRPVDAVAGSPSLPVVGVVALALTVAAVLCSLLVSVRLLPAAVGVSQVLRVLVLPATDAGLAPRSAAIVPRAIPAELRQRVLLPTLGAALQVIHGTGRPHDMPSPKRASFLPSHVTREQQPTHGAPRLRGLRLGSGTTPPVRPCPGGASRPRLGGTQARSRSPSHVHGRSEPR
jgi:hypothetical protein